MENGKFPCDFNFCTKTFTAKKSLLEHIRIHKGEKPYEWFQNNKVVFNLVFKKSRDNMPKEIHSIFNFSKTFKNS